MVKHILIGVFFSAFLSACSRESNDETVSAVPQRPECIAPSKPGGGFDLTCKLLQKGMMSQNATNKPMRTTYQPGGIGAVAYNTVVAQRAADGDVVVAFSSGSLLNLAQGKFGRYNENDVRWIAAVGIDYGVIAVKADSPYQNLGELIAALQNDPAAVVFGAGGTVGSQDWMKSAMIAREAGIDFKAMRYVPFEGGGEAQLALLGGHIQVFSGDISETQGFLENGDIRALAVLSGERLSEPFADVATAKEQGYDVSWPIVRGFYTGPEVSDERYRWWVDNFNTLLSDPKFSEIRNELGMFPYAKTGVELKSEITSSVAHYRSLVSELSK